MLEFKEFPKIARLSREICITEKIDGTNGVICITEEGEFLVGSRTRWIDEHTDNYNFWHWCMKNKEELLKLGVGTHFGEWWGSGIQRGYGLPKGERRFSLFNTGRWVKDKMQPLLEKQEYCPDCCYVVPILWTGIFDTAFIEGQLTMLKATGSKASPGFMQPEGIVIYHKAGNVMFKKTIEKDVEWKGKQQEKCDFCDKPATDKIDIANPYGIRVGVPICESCKEVCKATHYRSDCPIYKQN